MPGKGRLLAFDYGLKRIGTAVTDELQIIPRPLEILKADDPYLDRKLEDLIYEYRPAGIIVGYPIRSKGEKGTICTRIDEFIVKLSGMSGTAEIIKHDESFSSEDAEDIMRGKAGKKRSLNKGIDSLAACIILESYLNREKGL
ncbi:MAG: Holliday junction resolvase RuvX [Fibrobacterota bacterium]